MFDSRTKGRKSLFSFSCFSEFFRIFVYLGFKFKFPFWQQKAKNFVIVKVHSFPTTVYIGESKNK